MRDSADDGDSFEVMITDGYETDGYETDGYETDERRSNYGIKWLSAEAG